MEKPINQHTNFQFQELKKQFEENGYAVLPGFVTPEEVATLKGRIEHLIKEFEATEEFTIFSTKEQPVRSRPTPLPFKPSNNTLYVRVVCVVSCRVVRWLVSAHRRRRTSTSWTAGTRSGSSSRRTPSLPRAS